MPAPPVWMNSSGMDIQGTIQKLMELERQPAKRLEMDNEMNSVMIRAWEEVHKRSRTLQDKSRDLYSFSGPFALRSVTSSQPGAISGEATSNAQAGNQNVEVLSLASKHQVHSSPVANDLVLPAGSLSIGAGSDTRNFRFPGGTLRDLHALINAEANLPFEISRTGIDGDRSMISLRSNQSGLVGSLTFADPDGILQKIGLLGSGSGQDRARQAASLKGLRERERRGGSHKVEGNSIFLEDEVNVALEREFPALAVLHFKTELKKKEGKEIPVGPDLKETIAGVSLPNVHLNRRAGNKVASSVEKVASSIVIEYKDGDRPARVEVPYQPGEQSVRIGEHTGGKPASAVVFNSRSDEEIRIQNIEESMTGQPTAGLSPQHVGTPAQDARLKVNGVEITRSQNEKITDIMEGVSLNLHQTTQGPVQLKIDINSDDILKKINDWIAAYNDLMKFLRENSTVDVKSAQKMAETEGKNPDKVAAGVFATDATVRQLSNTLRSVISDAYPARYKPAYKLLADIGISTGAPGATFSDIQYGYLILDEDRLRQALEASPEAVKELFAQDSNSDTRLDHGAAYKMRESLDPYTRMARGIIPGRIDLIKAQSRSNTDRIARIEAGVQAKESSLRDRFGRMESAIGKSKATSNYLKNQMRQGGQD
ncbi:MAG: flagellar filament capping protein FliD [Spirochaetales bacterium]|nr:flagellar filament capping protein FliD [Spirochaetales bacterium]